MRVVKREGASTTLYLAPDFEVRDFLCDIDASAAQFLAVRRTR